MTIGSFSTSAQMPSNAGDCSQPETCAELGEVMVSEADCEMTAPPEECPGGCPVGQICLDGMCVEKNEQTSCEGRCCPGRNDSCTTPAARCFCDDFCQQARDCCADFGAACGG